MRRGHIPSAPIRVIVNNYVGNRDMGVRADTKNGQLYAATPAVAIEFGMAVRNLQKFLIGESHATSMPFDLADRMLGAMDLTHLWQSELDDIYHTVDLSEPPKSVEGKRRRWRECRARKTRAQIDAYNKYRREYRAKRKAAGLATG